MSRRNKRRNPHAYRSLDERYFAALSRGKRVWTDEAIEAHRQEMARLESALERRWERQRERFARGALTVVTDMLSPSPPTPP